MYRQIQVLSEAQVEQLYRLYQGEWWTRGRTLEETRRMLQHTPVIIALEEEGTGRLLGFTRVITDFVYKALILDVIVAPDQRGTGMGKALLDAVHSHEQLRQVKHLELYCRPELVPFYQRWGFTAELGELRFMRASRP